MPISVIIPSFRNPEYLDLCLKSLYDNQVNENQIIVILDGYAEESRSVIEKYNGLSVLPLSENRGQTFCHNHGVIQATNKWILMLNDDNVACREWDVRLEETDDMPNASVFNYVIAPNQIEPNPSIFKSFIIKDFGTTPDTFRYTEFLDFADIVNTKGIEKDGYDPDEKKHYKYFNRWHQFTEDGSSWPLFMTRKKYMILGGLDPYYPDSAVADWDFFYRCHLDQMQCVRYSGCHFYHFAGSSTKSTPEKAKAHAEKEQQSLQYFYYKWKIIPRRDENNRIIVE